MSRLDDVERRCQEAWTRAEPGVDALTLGADLPDLARDFRIVGEEALRVVCADATVSGGPALKAALAIVDAWLPEAL